MSKKLAPRGPQGPQGPLPPQGPTPSSRNSNKSSELYETAQPYQFPSSNLEFFTNNNFSSSFNLLILDDDEDKLNPPPLKLSRTANEYRDRRISRSPKVHQQAAAAAVGGSGIQLSQSNVTTPHAHSRSNVTTSHTHSHSFAASHHSVGSSSVPSRVLSHSKLNSAHSTSSQSQQKQFHQQLQLLSLHSPKVKPQRLFDELSISDADESINNKSNGTSQSQQSLIKRSSKFLNLLIDISGSTNVGKSFQNLRDDDIDEDLGYLSELNDVDTSFMAYAADEKHQSSSTPFASSSPIKATPFSVNKFKRPHKLVSQSPSPSLQGKLVNQSLMYRVNHQLVNESYSPSKMGGKGIKLLKNANKNAIISPNRSKLDPREMNNAFGTNFLGQQLSFLVQNPSILTQTSSLLHPSSATVVVPVETTKRVLSGSNKIRKSSQPGISGSNSPFTESVNHKIASSPQTTTDSSSTVQMNAVTGASGATTTTTTIPIGESIDYGFDYYNWEDLDIDIDESPSKANKKFPHSPGMIVYKDINNNSCLSKSVPKRKIMSVPDVVSSTFDNKENESQCIVPKKSSSYKFVKPLQTAFKSTGLKKKNSQNASEKHKLPPETPFKKHPVMHLGAGTKSDQQLNIQLSSSMSNGVILRGSSLSKVIAMHTSTNPGIEEPASSITSDSLIMDNSIEIGRNIPLQDQSLSDSSGVAFFNSSSTIESNKNIIPKDLGNNDMDIEFSDDDDNNDDLKDEIDNILGELDGENPMLETPTKMAVKKSSSTPASFSPVSFAKNRAKKSSMNKPVPLTINARATNVVKSNEEPSTPINNVITHRSGGVKNNGFKNEADHQSKDSITQSASNTSHRYSSTLNSINSSLATLCGESSKNHKIDDHLVHKFGMKNIKYLGTGEFSIAYECSFNNEKLAIKRTKRPVIGKQEKISIIREIDALRALTSVNDNEEHEEGKEYLVFFIEAWEYNDFYYIMTEFCEGGSLFDFLEENKNYRIDEFRIWKILIEILSGLKFIHQKNYLHLDLKPANIFVTFEGSLKIGDFGLATKLPILEKDFDLEGDRNYIAPELINDKIYTPFADIFSVGLVILEIAANIILPDNGTPWRKLRSGDLSDAGKLSSENISDFLQQQNFSSLSSYNSCGLSSASSLNQHFQFNPSVMLVNNGKDLIPSWAPEFLAGKNGNNLDILVGRMLRPNPFDRPTAGKILEMEECVTIENRRKAGATIYEGQFGPRPSYDD